MPIITLTTDFGLTDPFVGTMKGVIAGICPVARVVDITHGVTQFDIQDGAIKLWQAAKYFPAGTIHVAVVDPGVGSDRRMVVAHAQEQWFIAPDNGVLSWVLDGLDVQAWQIENPKYSLPQRGNTFHGRDIFAPVGAHLASGVAPEQFGRSTAPESLIRLPDIHARRESDGSLLGKIVLADRFGNLLSNIRANQLPEKFTLQIGNHTITSLQQNFSPEKPGEAFAIIGSSGLLEIAVSQASASHLLGVQAGEAVTLIPSRE